jgi:hypothetical protein
LIVGLSPPIHASWPPRDGAAPERLSKNFHHFSRDLSMIAPPWQRAAGQMNCLSSAGRRGRDGAAAEVRLPWRYAIPVIGALSLAAWTVVIVIATAVWQAT